MIHLTSGVLYNVDILPRADQKFSDLRTLFGIHSTTSEREKSEETLLQECSVERLEWVGTFWPQRLIHKWADGWPPLTTTRAGHTSS